jgi:hypothetical protein
VGGEHFFATNDASSMREHVKSAKKLRVGGAERMLGGTLAHAPTA